MNKSVKVESGGIMIDCLNLNYDWYYKPNFNQEYVLSSYSVKDFQQVNLPHSPYLPFDNFAKSETEKVFCYKREFQIDEKYNGKRIILNFQGVLGFFKVYINGNLVVSDNGGYTSFNFDITNFIEYGVKNFITLKVDGTKSEEKPETCDNEDFAVSCGLFREVYIKICDEEYFEHVLITPILQDNNWKVNLRCEFNTKIKTGRKLFYQLKKPDGEIITSGEKEVGFNNFIEMDIGVESPSIWTLQNPELYTCEVALGYEKEYVKFGFRKAEFKEGKFYLSGERIFLNGLTRKPSYPYACLAMPKSAQEQDAVILKNELGLNVVRCSEPPSKHFLNMCDKIGLMVFVEMPGTDGLSVNFENQQLILKKIKDMIYENYNHPSIILWGIRIKKTDINNDFYNKAIVLAEDLDKSRQTAGNRSFTGSKLFSSDFCIKEKVQNGSGKSKKCIIPEIGQNNIDAKSYEGELIRQNQALDYADDINKALSHKKFAGTIGQSMCDYNSTNTYGGGDNIKYSGVLDMFRVEKTSGIFYKSQQDKIPVLELTSSLATAERYKKGYGKIYIITNCDYVKFYKDEKLIKTYYPDKKHFSKLAHPPIEFDDFIGEELAENEKFSPSSAKVIKKALLYLAENGGDFIGGNKFKLMPLGKVLKKEDVSVHEFLRLYDKYICNRECKTYKLEGYIDNKLVITLNKGCSDDKKLEVKSDSEKLVENETYDTTRVVVKEKSDLGVLLNYGFDTITVKTNDLLEIIGPEKFTLIGGRRAFWVKTKGKSGKGEVTVTSDFGSETLEIEVIKK